MTLFPVADPLDSVLSHVPDWLKRLQDLNGQIEQRQLDLARFSESETLSSARSIRSIRPHGSTESLKPADDGVAFPTADPTIDAAPPLRPIITNVPATPDPANRLSGPLPPTTPGSEPRSGSSIIRHTNEVVASAQRRARATVRRRQKTDSMISAEGPKPQYRNRRMVLVYYDSFVQSFFEELVKFVSAQRNMMRKAKTAAKVAHIRRLAELEMPEEEADEVGELQPGTLVAADSALLPLGPRPLGGRGVPRSSWARSNALNGNLSAFNEKGDIWDELDKGLEFVQGMCERAAHQFLRDGDCNEEIEKIKTCLEKVKESAAQEKEKEKERAASRPEEPDSTPNGEAGANPVPVPVVRTRTYRPATVRRDFGASTPTNKQPASASHLEIDDEGIQIQDVDDFKPVYRSTRLMRRPV